MPSRNAPARNRGGADYIAIFPLLKQAIAAHILQMIPQVQGARIAELPRRTHAAHLVLNPLSLRSEAKTRARIQKTTEAQERDVGRHNESAPGNIGTGKTWHAGGAI